MGASDIGTTGQVGPGGAGGRRAGVGGPSSGVDAPPGGVWETLDALVGQWNIPRPVAVVEVCLGGG